MRVGTLTACLLCLLAAAALPQTSPSNTAQEQSNSPATMRYANMPPLAVPFGRFRKPYQEWYVESNTLEYNGAARTAPAPDLKDLKAVDIGFLGPLGKDNPESPYGIAMLHGAQMAIDEANAQGGFQGKPFALKIHDDLPLWGASSMDIVRMLYSEHAWAMFGSIDGSSTHIALRATLKLELPIMDTGTTDPTVTETRIQWLLHNFPDDRQQGYALADYIFNQLKLRQVGVLRVNSRYGRRGHEEFFNDARRIGYQPLVVVKYPPNATDFSSQLQALKNLGIDSLLIWGDATQAGMILKQMRSMGMNQPVFGSSRVAYPELLKVAGPAANGLVAISAIDPSRHDPKWQEFREGYAARYHEEPDAYASYAYDGMNILVAAIQKAGLNRGRIMDALREHGMKRYDGVSGTAFFDYTLNNIAPVTFAKVKDGQFVYWPEHRTDWKDGNPIVSIH
ncbi:MAG TPA: ABC transporter substrate-binding protein [Terriglobia bacterium]|nr:ABC transporter substrate-binding protein [Terriglobia bacterium]